MFLWVRKLLARSPGLSAAFGDVVFVTLQEKGVHRNHSFFEWRVKRSLDGRIFVSAMMVPDNYAGPEGSPTNYINFDIEAATRLRASLDECIEHARSLLSG